MTSSGRTSSTDASPRSARSCQALCRLRPLELVCVRNHMKTLNARCRALNFSMLHPLLVSGMSKEQVAIKIAHDILKYPADDAQAKLSLLQDLVITLLPGARESVDLTKALQGCRSRCNSEDVVKWMDALLALYLSLWGITRRIARASRLPLT